MLYRSTNGVSPSWAGALAQSVERSLQVPFGIKSLLLSVAFYAACAAVLLLPGVFFVSFLLNDTFIYTETGYRLALGQVPGLDITHALGVFTYAPYAFAYHLTGDAIEAIPESFVIFGGIVLTLAAVIAFTRLSAVVGTVVVCACALFTIAPSLIGYDFAGEAMTTAAGNYNRFGFMIVLLAALLTIEPRWRGSAVGRSIDLAWAIVATMLAYYSKMPFGLGAAGLIGFWLLVMRRDWLGTIVFAAGCAAVASGVERLWPGLNIAYIHEMIFATHANGGAVMPFTLAMFGLHTAPEFLAFAALPLTALFLVKRADRRDAIFAVLLVGGSLLLLGQATQGLVLVTPVAIAVIAVTRLSIIDATPIEKLALRVSLVACIAGFTALAIPAAVSIAHHTRYALAARNTPIAGMPSNFRSLRVIDDGDVAALDAAMTGSPDAAKAFIAARARVERLTRDPLFENEYAHTIAKLTQARDLCGDERDRTAVLDYVNVSSSLFGHRPVGGWSYLHWGRSFSATAFVPAARLFAGVGCLFDPKLPQFPETHAGIWSVYGAYLHTHYRLAGETPFWRVYVMAPGSDNRSGPKPPD